GAADARQVDADLVCPSRPRLDAAKAEAAETLDHFIVTHRVLAVVIVLVGDRHLDAVVRVMGDAALDVIAVAVEHSRRQGDVFLENLALLEQHAQITVRLLLLGYKDDAAGIAVETVDDAGAVVAVDAAELVEVEAQGVNEGAGPVALGRVDDHVGRLVDG